MRTRQNDFPGRCKRCGCHVDAGKGLLMKPPIPPRVARLAAKAPIRWGLFLFCEGCVPRPKTC